MDRKEWRAKSIVFAFLVSLEIPTLAGCGGTEVRPQIRFDAVKVRAGQVVQGKKIQTSFGFQNVGGAELTVENVVGTCRCTATLDGPLRVAPGDRGVIVADVDTRWLGAGETAKDVLVTTNDPIATTTKLTVQLEVVPEFTIDVPTLDFGMRSSAQQSQSRVVVVRHLVDGLAITGVESEDDRIQAVVQSSGVKGETVIRASQKPGVAAGWLIDGVRVKTSSQALPEFRIPLRGRINHP